ncbi:MAG TPA: mandelate racemase/muconate lactonizing enzyme family protein [Vicinamibacterales bacterium]|nr:mandelate racemase/muconate lactonizing enzyme family protein [Vicinamibacterales bacterium]
MRDREFSRRDALRAGGALLLAPILAAANEAQSDVPRLRVTAFELLSIRATSRTVWLVVRLRTDAGLTGLGEASDAFGFANTTDADASVMQRQLQAFFTLIEGRSPFDIEAFRQRGQALARQGLVQATAFSAIEQALWDLAGKALNIPTYVFFGGKVRETLPVYANINRATEPRTPAGFGAAAARAVRDGFRAIKAAPFDGFPQPGSPSSQVEAAVQTGIACVAAMREAVGPGVRIMVDCHSFFDVPLAVRVARELEPHDLTWYEEPVAPDRVEETVEIRSRIRQSMAGGELLFGVSGFAPLVRRRACHVIMPDVKHCGGLLELTHIAAMAASEDVMVAPHNPSGPISTAASVQVCAGLNNFNFLELQYAEAAWRSEVVTPAERFVNGTIAVPDRPGFGVELTDAVIRQRATLVR